jgi:arylformamidase
VKVFDITPEIDEKLAVFPGDVPFSRNISMDFKSDDHLLLSSIKTTLHLGAHADSSSHYHAEGMGIEQRPLTVYFGKAQVISIGLRAGERISLRDLDDVEIKAERVLFKTNSFPNPQKWNGDFMSLSPEVIEFLHLKDVVLVGIDTPSVDPETSKALESHQALYRTKMAVLEGLVLTKVPEGVYSLVALPLPIKNADASPVRALLFEESDLFSKTSYQVVK